MRSEIHLYIYLAVCGHDESICALLNITSIKNDITVYLYICSYVRIKIYIYIYVSLAQGFFGCCSRSILTCLRSFSAMAQQVRPIHVQCARARRRWSYIQRSPYASYPAWQPTAFLYACMEACVYVCKCGRTCWRVRCALISAMLGDSA